MEKIPLTEKEKMVIQQIRGFLIQNGSVPSLRKISNSLGYKSPRSANILVNQLIEKGILQRVSKRKYVLNEKPEDTLHAKTVCIPLIGTVACGIPILAEENYQGKISVSTKLIEPGYKHFILKAKGDSMNQKGINDGDLVLVRQQITAKEGDTVVALIDDEAAIKEFHYAKNFIILRPRSSNPVHKPIILTNDFQIQGIVVATIPNV